MNFIIDNFEMLFDSEEHLKRLEDIILDLAVKGKLVPQNAEDEPASVLIGKIKAEKERLIKEKKIKKYNPFEPIKDEEKPFEIPESWEWVRLGEIGETQTGTTPPTGNAEYFNGNIPFIKPADISDKGINYNNESLTEKGLEKGRLIEKNSVLMVCIGGSTGKAFYVDRDCSCNQQINAITGYLGIQAKFIYFFITSPEYLQRLLLKATGTATPIINKSKWEGLLFPLPPLAEQKRIVEKVDNLKKLTETIKEKIKSRDNSRQNLKKSIMSEIEKSDSNIDLLNSLEMVFKNFDIVVKDKGDIKDIRNLILSMAVKGKLVPQNEDDEPASVLLDKIKAEKERLIKEKKIKKDNQLEPIKEEEKPFEIPESWELVRLGELVEFLNGCAFESNSYVSDSKNQIIRLGNVKNDLLLLSVNPAYIPDDIANESLKYRIEKNDILFTMTGTRGRRDYFYTLLVQESDVLQKNLFLNQRVGCLKASKKLSASLVNIFLKSNVILNMIFETETGTANQGNIGTKATLNLLFPLPPLEEQKRIVEQVGKLMTYCDDLENKIEESRKEKELLISSMVQGIVSK